VRQLPYDVERDMAFYRTVVGFRNAVERTMLSRGTLGDAEHVFWGFGGPPPRYPERGADDDGMAGSRMPRHPYPGTGGAVVRQEQVDWEASAEMAGQVADKR
jgi:hypothetical protein